MLDQASTNLVGLVMEMMPATGIVSARKNAKAPKAIRKGVFTNARCPARAAIIEEIAMALTMLQTLKTACIGFTVCPDRGSVCTKVEAAPTAMASGIESC